MDRLDKLLSQAHVASRREIRDMIRSGRIQIDGRPAKSGEEKVDAESVQILVDGRRVMLRKRLVLLLHKPAGFVTSTSDPRDRTVMELLPPDYQGLGLFPVGRLDKDTEGLLLLTDDGDLAHRLTSPRHHVQKEYLARHQGAASEADTAAFAAGMVLRDGTVCRPAVLIPEGEGQSRILLSEGKYHQVKRMMAARGMTVTYLKRLSFGPIQLGALPLGQCRELSREETDSLG